MKSGIRRLIAGSIVVAAGTVVAAQGSPQATIYGSCGGNACTIFTQGGSGYTYGYDGLSNWPAGSNLTVGGNPGNVSQLRNINLTGRFNVSVNGPGTACASRKQDSFMFRNAVVTGADKVHKSSANPAGCFDS